MFRRMFLGWAMALGLAAPLASQGAEPIALYCARGVPDYPDAEMRLNVRGSHVVQVTYVGYQPSRARAEWALRDCLNTAVRLDASHDILASLWYRERHSPDVRPIPNASLVYRAASGAFAAP